MTTYEIIAKLCNEHGIAITALEKSLGFGRGYIGKFKTKGTIPTVKKLQKIADYFGVSVDYLMTGEEREGDKYYLSEETAEMAQAIFENPDLRVLFDAAKDATSEDLKTTYDMLMALKKKERGEDVY